MIVQKSFALCFILLLIGGCSSPQSSDNKENDDHEGSKGNVENTIETSIDYSQKGDTIYFQFHLKNQSEKAKTYHFNTGQRFDYVIKNDDGEKVKQFSKGAMFTQVLGEETLKQGAIKTYKAKVADLTPGKYSIEIWLTAKEAQPKARATFTVNQGSGDE